MQLTESDFKELVEDILDISIKYIDNDITYEKFNEKHEQYYESYINVIRPKLMEYFVDPDIDQESYHTINQFIRDNELIEKALAQRRDLCPIKRKVYIYWLLDGLGRQKLRDIFINL
jgi:hypothetical protein